MTFLYRLRQRRSNLTPRSGRFLLSHPGRESDIRSAFSGHLREGAWKIDAFSHLPVLTECMCTGEGKGRVVFSFCCFVLNRRKRKRDRVGAL